MSISRKSILRMRYSRFGGYGFNGLESETLAKSRYKFNNVALIKRISRRNRKVLDILEADRKISLRDAVARAAIEDPLLEPSVGKVSESKSTIIKLLRRLS